METLENIDKELNKLSHEFLEKLRENDSLNHFIRNFIVNIICKEVDLEINFDEFNKSFCKKNNIQTEADFSKYLELKGMTIDDHKRNLVNGEKIYYIAKNKFSKKAESEFINNKNILGLYKYDLLSISESDLAHEIYFQLESEETNIMDLKKKQYSMKSKLNISSYGPNDLVKTNPNIREKLVSLHNGEFSYPFKFSEFWMIVYLKEKKEAEFNQLTKTKMILALFEEWINLLTVESVKKFLTKT